MEKAEKKCVLIYIDLLDALEPFSDAERGRLFTAVLEYSRTGIVPEISGNERFLFPMIRAQLDRDDANYTEKCKTNSKNGKLGGAPVGNNNRKQTTLSESTDINRKQATSSESSLYKEEEEEKKEEKDKETTATVAGASLSVAMTMYLDKINPTASQRSLDELKGYVDILGHEACVHAMEIALDCKNTTWNYIRGILRDYEKHKVACIADVYKLEAAHEGRKLVHAVPNPRQIPRTDHKDWGFKSDL